MYWRRLFLEQHFLGKWIALTYRATQTYMADQLKNLQIGYGQFPFLVYLNRCGPSSQEEIAQALFFDKGTTARALKTLEERGYIARSVSGKDRRRNIVEVTDSGKAVAIEIRRILKDWNEALTKGLTAEQKAGAYQLITSLAQNATEKVKKLHKKQDDRR